MSLPRRIFHLLATLALLALMPGPGRAQSAPTVRTVTLHHLQKVRIAALPPESALPPEAVAITLPPALGTAVVDLSGGILYTHTTGTPAADTFTYEVATPGEATQVVTVQVEFATGLRIAPVGLNIPPHAPATAVQVVPAFPGLTFVFPLGFTSPPGDTQRLCVAQRYGQVKVIPDVAAETPVIGTMLDLPAVLAAQGHGEWIIDSPNGETGLLGVAFHPQYATNGYLYVCYSAGKTTAPGIYFQRIARFTVPAEQRGLPVPQADPASELILLEQPDREDSHNGGDLHFGPDGYLYCAFGDEGNPYDHFNNTQRIDGDFFAAMLRIDVDKKPGNLEPNPHSSVPLDAGLARYAVPADNPYVGAETFAGAAVNPTQVRTEFWAVGLRSPWRFTIDEPTGEVWLGDVGQESWEEVNLITAGGNYGWAYREGLYPAPLPVPRTPPPGLALTDPIYAYAHYWNTAWPAQFRGESVIGGVVYRGTRFASLTGAYIFGDFMSGNICALTRPGGVPSVQRLTGLPRVTAFGTDPSNGDVLLTDYFNGRIMRLVTTTPGGDFPTTLSATGLFADLTDLSPAPGVLPYAPNLPFWSDHALKKRWFAIPGLTDKMTWSRDGLWEFPAGQIWVKHFDLETERGNPATKQRIETRVLVKTATGNYGVSYRWNAEGTEAVLAEDGGETVPVEVTVNGTPEIQSWRIPSRAQCATCHTAQTGPALSFTTRQLNRVETIEGFAGNQLELLSAHGYFANAPEPVGALPRHVRADETASSLEARARSYLAVNCAYCHAGAGGTAPTAWDGRPELTLGQTGLMNGVPSNNGGNLLNKLLVPGDTAHSIVLNRMAVTNGFTRMPPLATSELDSTNIALLADWIAEGLASSVAPPVSLAAAGSGANIALTWADQSSNEDGFSIEQSTDGNSYSVIATAGTDLAGYSVGPLAEDQTYFFRVRAFGYFNPLTYSPYAVVAAHSKVTAEATSALGAVVNYQTANASNLYGVASLSYSQNSGTVFPLGVTAVTLSATTAASNTTTGTFTVTVRDTTGPVITVPANIVAEATDAGGAMVSYTVSATDAVDGPVSALADYLSGSIFPLGATTVQVIATDSRNNTTTATFTVTVQDTTAPLLAAHSNVIAEATSPAGAVVNYAPGSATDAVTVSPGIYYTPESGTEFPLGVTTVAVSATDAAANTTFGTFTVTVRDTTGPIIAVPANIVAEATDVSGAMVSFVVSATDAVDGSVTALSDYLSGTVFPFGTTTVLVTATENSNNSSTATFTVTVQDTTPPVFAAHGNVIVEATSAVGAVVNYDPGSATDAVTVSPEITYSPASGTFFQLGVTTVTMSAADAAANTVTGTFTVTVRDTTGPVITVSENIVVEATDASGAVVSFSVSASDAVDGSVTALPDYLSGTIFPLGTTTVLVTATDTRNNTSTATFTVTVQDTTAPALAAHGNVVVEATSPAGAVVNYAPGSATDAVTVSLEITYSPASGTVFPLGVTTVTMSATDAAANTITGTFTVTVRDTTGPVITVPANIVAEAIDASGAVVSFSVSASDAVDGSVTALPDYLSGTIFPLGTTTVLVTATDTRNNTSTATFTVTVQDTTAPALAAHGNVVVEATSPAGAVVNHAPGSATDAVTVSPEITYSPASGAVFPLGVTTVTMSATDTAANTITGTFTVTVRDTTGPVITVSENIVVEATDASGAVVSFSVSANDAVDGSVTALPDYLSGTIFPLGTTTVLVTAADTRNNTSTATFNVTVQDTTAPALAAHDNVVVEATSPAGAVVNHAPGSATDAVTVSPEITYSPASGAVFPLGVTTVTMSATDAAANTVTGTFTVTVRDTTGPVITVPENIVAEATDASGAVVSFSVSANDAVDGSVTALPDYLSGTIFPLGTTTVLVTAADTRNNTSTATFNVTVQDTTPPVVMAPANIVAPATSPSGALVSYSPAVATDAVSAVSLTYSQSSATMFPIGVTMVLVTATDVAGNSATASFTVTVSPLSALQSWRFSRFGSIANAGDAADLADPYQTGIPNLLLFAFFGPNQNPTEVSLSQLPQAQLADGHLYFDFVQPDGVSGITYSAEMSDNLELPDWQAIPDSGFGPQHLFSVPVDEESQLFIRLRVTSP